MPGRTRAQSRAVREETGLQSGESEQALSHDLGSLSMMGRAALVSMMAEHEEIYIEAATPRPTQPIGLPSEGPHDAHGLCRGYSLGASPDLVVFDVAKRDSGVPPRRPPSFSWPLCAWPALQPGAPPCPFSASACIATMAACSTASISFFAAACMASSAACCASNWSRQASLLALCCSCDTASTAAVTAAVCCARGSCNAALSSSRWLVSTLVKAARSSLDSCFVVAGGPFPT